ncbi:MAG: UDP-glucose 4-epimerase GalE [Roseiflexaceae bacterium]|nr:UDP-glucose 4-epimerase GalE [Roseiflexaceae bacterium]
MTHILVTGGAGYIGSITVRLLRERGYQVTVIDSLERGFRAALGDAPLIAGDLRDIALLDRVFSSQPIDAVMHFAAYKAVGESVANPLRYFENNLGGTLALLAAMRRAGVRQFVFSSTAAVYGTPDYTPVDEAHPTRPESPYGESKLQVEHMLRWLGHSGDLKAASLRYYNVAGAARDGQMGEASAKSENLIPVVMRAILGSGPALKVYGTDYPTPDGTCIRDYVHVIDLAEAHIKALEFLNLDVGLEVFNLGSGKGVSVLEVLREAERVSGRSVPVEYAERRAGDPVGVWADTRKAASLLGWHAQHGLAEIVESSWQWHSTHPAGYQQ